MERSFGYAVARAYAGHNDRQEAGVTATYVRRELYEVAEALSALTGELHPLAPTPDDGKGPEEAAVRNAPLPLSVMVQS